MEMTYKCLKLEWNQHLNQEPRASGLFLKMVLS